MNNVGLFSADGSQKPHGNCGLADDPAYVEVVTVFSSGDKMNELGTAAFDQAAKDRRNSADIVVFVQAR